MQTEKSSEELTTAGRPKFRFKRFELSDTAGAMKIGTDGVLLGAWAGVAGVRLAWDVGAGTGLIALMLAQRGVGRVRCFEINSAAAAEARDNIRLTEWSQAIELTEGDFASEWPELDERPDLIVSNPPFFNESLKSPSESRALARHEGSLSFESLFAAAEKVLSPEGRLCVIAPAQRTDDLIFSGELHRLSPARIVRVATTPSKSPKRVMIEWRRSEVAPPTKVVTLSMRSSDGQPSDEYIALTRDFYLNIH